MPVRFTCRLVATKTESGKYRIKYSYLGDECFRIFTLIGPSIVEPPKEELTAEELEQWEMNVSLQGFSSNFVASFPVNAPLLEACRTYEDEIPKNSVTSELRWVQNEQGERTFAVVVTNSWDRKIPNFSLAVTYQCETPQPAPVGGIAGFEIGGSLGMFFPMPGIQMKDLIPNRQFGYFFHPRGLDQVRSRCVALSPENHWISLRTDDQEFDRIPGDVVATFLAELDQDKPGDF